LATGLPAVLVRLSGCNLDCNYCDSQYARQEAGLEVEAADLVREIRRLEIPRVLLTGGEPLLQKEGVAELARLLCQRTSNGTSEPPNILRQRPKDAASEPACVLAQKSAEVLIETNGTLPIADAPRDATLVVDVKTPGAVVRTPFLDANLPALSPRDQLKFVLTDRADYRFALSFLTSHTIPIAPGNVLFSPAWGRLSPAVLAEWMLEDRVPYRFHLQVHKAVWGERRGV